MALYPLITILNPGTVGTQSFGQVQISVYDSSTGLPANGNNMAVNYTQNLNGTITIGNQVISGLSAAIYTGLLRNTATGYYTSFNINSYIEGGGIPPDPAADDLTIVNVITTPETAIGSDDGMVTINATSSFPAIEYSIDGQLTWHTDNVFTGQLSGLGTAWARDQNGGITSRPYTVGLIGNILVSDPTVDLGNGNLSKWNAAFNPIWFKYQRKDFEIISITFDNIDGFGILVLVNADLTSVKARSVIPSSVPGQPAITSYGDMVYINTAKYAGTYEVLAVTGSVLTLTAQYTTDDTTGFININSLRPGYKVQTQITYVDPITGQFAAIISNNYPFPDGHTNVDLSSFLKSLVRAKDYSTYSLVNYRDMQLSASYQMQYAEVWTGNNPQWTTVARPYYVTFTARQLQQIGGGNMQEFVPYPLGFQPAKWVCDFDMPVYSEGFPFDLGFIFSEYMVGLAAYYEIILLDINQVPLTDQSIPDGVLLNEDGTYILNQDGSKFIIAQGSLGVGLVEHVGLNRLLINQSLPSECWYLSVQIKYDTAPPSGSPVTYPLTKPIIVRVADRGAATDERPVYLRWIGLTGSWNYFKFVYNQVVTLAVTNPVLMRNFVTDWQNEDTITDVISKNASKSMAVYGENVTVSDIEGLQSIKSSSKVQIYIGAIPSGQQWATVVVKEGAFTEFETFIKAYNFSIQFALPDVNVQYQ